MGKTYRIYRNGLPRIHPDNPVTPEHPEQAMPTPAPEPVPEPLVPVETPHGQS